MIFHQLFDDGTSTFTYLLGDESTGEALIIDPVKEQTNRDLKQLQTNKLRLRYIVETHIHADHITGASSLRNITGARICTSLLARLSCSDVQLANGDSLQFGQYAVTVIETPGHTAESISLLCDDKLFTGDCLFIGGAGRTDFQGGSPADQWQSITEILFKLPGTTLVYPAHDYNGQTVSAIKNEIANNRVIGQNITREVYITNEMAKDRPPPKNMAITIPTNRICGQG
jgi:glyoxylase-like metal-dependent hydrolase (beta-lactamase superfamily II)